MEKFKLTMGFILQQRLLEHSREVIEKFASEKDILLSHIQKHNSKIPVDMALKRYFLLHVRSAKSS